MVKDKNGKVRGGDEKEIGLLGNALSRGWIQIELLGIARKRGFRLIRMAGGSFEKYVYEGLIFCLRHISVILRQSFEFRFALKRTKSVGVGSLSI